MSQNKKFLQFFVFKGEVGVYDDVETARKKGGSITNVIGLTTTNIHQALPILLKDIARTRRDVDFKKLYPFIKEKDIGVLESIQRQHIFTVAYVNRLIFPNGASRYGIWFYNEHQSYYYVTSVDINRRQMTDEIILIKLKELSKKYGFNGVLRTPFPVTKIKEIVLDWEIQNIKGYAYDLPMLSLIEVLKGNDSLIPASPLR